jgi:hypothetical protein
MLVGIGVVEYGKAPGISECNEVGFSREEVDGQGLEIYMHE